MLRVVEWCRRCVEKGDGEGGVGEDFVPLPKALISGDDDAFVRGVAFVDRFEQERRVFTLEGLETNLVEHEQVGTEQRRVEDLQAVLFACNASFFDEVVQGQEVRSVTVLDRFQGETERGMGLSDAGGSENQDGLPLMQEPQGGEPLNGGFRNAGLRIEVGVLSVPWTDPSLAG